jgi:hypothetical protein
MCACVELFVLVGRCCIENMAGFDWSLRPHRDIEQSVWFCNGDVSTDWFMSWLLEGEGYAHYNAMASPFRLAESRGRGRGRRASDSGPF